MESTAKEIDEVLNNLIEKRITYGQARDKLFVLYDVLPRFVVDLRIGCGAVKDRLHPNYNPIPQELDSDTYSVVEYREGCRHKETNHWYMKQEDIDFLNQRCDSLNNVVEQNKQLSCGDCENYAEYDNGIKWCSVCGTKLS